MDQQKRDRALAVLTLAVALMLFSPPAAHAAQRLRPVGLWEWVESLWREGVGGGWRAANPAPPRGGKAPATPTKQGVCVDPNGCANLMVGVQGPACSRFNDQGVCVDPNG